MINKMQFLQDHIDELKEILELDEFPDLESKLAFAEYLGNCEDWVKSNTPVKSNECTLCKGAGKFKEYDDEWACHSCFGTGSYFNKA